MAAKPLAVSHTTGTTVYAIAVANSNTEAGQYFDFDNGVLEDFNAASWGDYDIPMTEDTGTGLFRAGFSPPNGVDSFDVIYYEQAGGSPAVTDTKISAAVYRLEANNWQADAGLAV